MNGTNGQYNEREPGRNTQQTAWEYYNNAWHNVQPGQAGGGYGGGTRSTAPQPQPPQKRRRMSPLGVVALLLACTLFGFGGGALALRYYGGGQTVVYKSVEPGATATGLGSVDGASVSDVAALAKQSVVSISTENLVADFTLAGRVVSGAGSGVIISEDGTILTNNHVVEGARNITVTLADGTEYAARLVGNDAESDVAVIKIEAEGLTPAVIGNSDSLAVGEFCLAIGNPLGQLGGTVTDGIISALDRQVDIDGVSMNLLQMSAAVSPGNSGGGLFNGRGELIGLVNAKSSDGGAEGLGFAIPVNTAMQVAEQLITTGDVERVGLGVTLRTVSSAEEAAQMGLSGTGVYISYVNSGSGAEAAGLQVGDKLLEVNGRTVNASDDISAELTGKKAGDVIGVAVERNATRLDFEVELGLI